MSAYHNPCKHLLWVAHSSSGVLKVVPRASLWSVFEPSTHSLKECDLALSLCRTLQVFKELLQASGNAFVPEVTLHE